MNGLWIILLDKSSSMAGPFRGTLKFEGDIEYGPETTKIESAKRRLIKEIKGLSSVDVIVIEFASSADVVIRATSNDVRRISEKVEQIKADGPGTNIAAALRLAAGEATGNDARPKTILLISDGLSNEDDPIAASEQCRDAGLIIDTILIDPTDEGNALAKTISVGGWVRAAGSEAQADAAMAEAAAPYRAQPSAAAPESPFPKLITVIAACLGVFGAATGLVSSSLDKPSLFPWAMGIIFLAACPLLLYVVTARLPGPSLYKSPTELYESTYHKYGKFRRLLALAGVTVLIILAAGAFESGWERRRIIQIRLANETDRIVHDVELVFVGHEEERFYAPDWPIFRGDGYSFSSYFGTIKPHEATTYKHFNEVDLPTRAAAQYPEGTLIALRSEIDSRFYFSTFDPKKNRVVWRAFLDRKYTCVMRKDPADEPIPVKAADSSALPVISRPYGTFILSCSQDGGY